MSDYDAHTRLPRSCGRGEPARFLKEAARIEIGIASLPGRRRFRAFTTCFEDLHGMAQLPGLAVQRLMADGYGFGAEGGLEDGGPGARNEGDGRGSFPAYLLHGGLHLSS